MQILSEGQTVRHQQYGLGTVTESNVERTTIDFDNHGVKKFVTSLMVVELSNLTPPKGFRSKWVKTEPAARPARRGVPARRPRWRPGVGQPGDR